jgi:hypothetical protein
MRTCPFHNCDINIPDDKFACREHWHSLSTDEKRQVIAAYGRYLRNEIGVEELRQIQQKVLGNRGIA